MSPNPIQNDQYYHIYNCGINGCNIFNEPDDYERFLDLYNKYIEIVAGTFAWVLMGNHFHFLVRIKTEDEIGYYKNSKDNDSIGANEIKIVYDLSEIEDPVNIRKPNATRHFSHLFNAYAKYFNKKYNRHGSLFEKPFKRKEINSEDYFKQVVIYIHNNPVHHHFCQHPMEYPWSSYLTCISVKPTKLHREKVIGWFNDLANFKYMHNHNFNTTAIEKWLEI